MEDQVGAPMALHVCDCQWPGAARMRLPPTAAEVLEAASPYICLQR